MEQKKDKIVLHACCGICSGYPVSFLKDAGYQVIVYFYNPNIYPEYEYLKRLDAERKLCAHFGCELYEENYNPDEFYNAAAGLEEEPEKGKRCDKCFELRLTKTAEFAKSRGIDKFTTSIVISPHKNFEKLTEIGERVAKEYNLQYMPYNFRKQDGFFKTNQISRGLELYRQNYCGCKFSLR